METREAYLKREADEYISQSVLTQAERKTLRGWVKDGNSVYENPWCLADDRGRPMDFVTATREIAELRSSHEA